jgi:hypothetical protein
MENGYYEKWQGAHTTEERLAIITEELRALEEKISCDFAFLKDLGYGTPEFVRRNDGPEGADCAPGDDDHAPHIEGIYKNGKDQHDGSSRLVTISGDLSYGFVHVQARITNTKGTNAEGITLSPGGEPPAEDVNDYFTYEGYRRYAKRRDPCIEYYELHCHKIETLTDFYFQTGYNWDRPACFMAEGIIAVAHNPNEGGNAKTSSVIELYDTTKKLEEPYRYENKSGETEFEGVYVYYKKTKTIPFDGANKTREEDQDPSFTPVCNEVYGDLYYDSKRDVFIGMGEQQGLYISDSEGKVLLIDPQYADYRYTVEFRVFYRFSVIDGGYKADVIGLDTILEQ